MRTEGTMSAKSHVPVLTWLVIRRALFYCRQMRNAALATHLSLGIRCDPV